MPGTVRRDRKRSGDRIQPHATQFSEDQLPHKMNAVDDLDATIKGCRTAAWTLALGSLVLVAALSWQPLALLVDTMMWPNFAMGCLSQVALIACAAGSCVMITTVASGHKPAVTRRFAIAQYKPCGRFRGGEPGDVLRRRTAVRVVPTGVPEPEPCLIVVASAVVVRAARVDSDPGVVGGHALFEPLSSTPVGKCVAKAGRVVS